MVPSLYTFRRCPYAIRARLAIAAAQIQVIEIEVDLRHKPAELFAASSKGTVPVLVLDDSVVIDESVNIMVWALQDRDPSHWLTDGSWSVAGRDLVQRCDTEFKEALDRYKYADRSQDGSRDEPMQTAQPFLNALEGCLLRTAHLDGERRSITDAAIMPFVRQFAGVDPAWFAQAPLPRLRAWLLAWICDPLFENVMRKPALVRAPSDPLHFHMRKPALVRAPSDPLHFHDGES